MAHASGSALVITFGATTISGDQRTMTWNDNIDTADSTAGSDAAKSHVTTTYGVDGSFQLVENGTDSSAIYQALTTGASGTLTWYPYGTATGNPIYQILATITQIQQEAPYDNVQMRTYNWMGNGPWLQNYNEGDTA